MEGLSYTDEGDTPHPASESADAPLDHEDFIKAQERALGQSLGANYGKNSDEDWTLLLYNRLRRIELKKRFLDFKHRFPTTEARDSSKFRRTPGEELDLDKPVDIPKDNFEQALNGYDTNLENVFASTRYHYAKGQYFDGNNVEELESHTERNGGASAGYGDVGSVFIDAKDKENIPYTNRSKNIIEAHEKAHGVFGHLTQGERRYIWDIFGHAKIGYKYKDNPEEILIRLTQIKNYFGFKGDEKMTLSRLRYAKNHYVENTRLDNNMTEFFAAITPENEQKVVDLMNEYPC